MTRKLLTVAAACSMSLSLLAGCDSEDDDVVPEPEPGPELSIEKEAVGKLLYFDTNLSSPPGQSCASCHSPDTGFAEPHLGFPTSQGANPHLFGNRNAPSAAYAAFSPEFHFDEGEGLYEGGQFWDGRATNLIEQAKGPFLNPVEMGMADEAAVIAVVHTSEYAQLFELIYGETIWDDVTAAYEAVADAVAAFEQGAEVNRFSSKYDAYLAGEANLTTQELQGLQLYEDPAKGNCAACHPSQAGDDEPAPLFTDFTYDNLGTPPNPDNPFYGLPSEFNPDGAGFVDLGLGGELGEAAENGKFKVPTLRNIALTAPYMHNGVFATLEDVVRFYNTRDTDDTWPDPEVADNMNSDELGDLGLTPEEEADIVAFLRTLSDGWAPAP